MRIPLRVDLSAIDREAFTVAERQTAAGPLWLVCPKKQKLKWEPGEEHLRSLLCRADGTVVSSGFPKFSNYGERADLDAMTDEAVAAGRAVFTEKLDGSLIIRSVVDGRVLWRTRGSHELGVFEQRVMAVVRDRHPNLLDPGFADWPLGLLFEFTSPDNVIVLRYPEPRLTLLGGVNEHGDLFIGRGNGLAWGLAEVGVRDIPGDVHEARAAVASWDDQEGVVAWCSTGRGWHLAKFKSARYIAMHAFKAHITEAKVWAYCHARGIACAEALEEAFREDALDWEMVEHARPWVASYLQRVDGVSRAYSAIWQRLQAVADANRKTKALTAKAACDEVGRSDLFGWAIAAATGNDTLAEEHVAALVLGMTVNEYRAKRPTMAALAIGAAPDE